MIGFVEWLDKKGFWIKDWYDEEKDEWQSGGGWLMLQPHQREILSHCLTPDDNGKFPYTTIVYSCPKKSGKSAVAAAVTQWAAEELDPGSEIFIAANSREQAEGRIMRDLKYHVNHSGREYPIPKSMQVIDGLDRDRATVNQYKVLFPSETFVEALARNHASAAGSRHALSTWDELWGYTTEHERKLWDELTPIPTVKVSLQFIATYAGYEGESDLLWDVYINGVGEEEHQDGRGTRIEELGDLPCYENGRQFTYWEHENKMPWQTDEYLENQFTSLRPSAYLRLHENRWVTSRETFISLDTWKGAVELGKSMGITRSADYWIDHPYFEWPMWIGADAATIRDSTAMVGVTYDAKNGIIIQMFHKIWTPVKGEEFNLETTLADGLIKAAFRYNVQQIAYDDTQLYQLALNLRKSGLPMTKFSQSASNMTKASQALFDVLQKRAFVTYPDEEAELHIKRSIAIETGSGYRIIKDKSKARTHKIDFTIALAMAVHSAISAGGVEIGAPIRIQSAFSDTTAWGEAPKYDQSKLPPQFRS